MFAITKETATDNGTMTLYWSKANSWWTPLAFEAKQYKSPRTAKVTLKSINDPTAQIQRLSA